MPLKSGFWLEDEGQRIFVIVTYEKIPTFCYTCGMVGHGLNACKESPAVKVAKPSKPSSADLSADHVKNQSSAFMDVETIETMNEADVSPEEESIYGPWMVVTRRSGRGGARGGGGGRWGSARGGGRGGGGAAGSFARDSLVTSNVRDNVIRRADRSHMAEQSSYRPTRGVGGQRGRGSYPHPASHPQQPSQRPSEHLRKELSEPSNPSVALVSRESHPTVGLDNENKIEKAKGKAVMETVRIVEAGGPSSRSKPTHRMARNPDLSGHSPTRPLLLTSSENHNEIQESHLMIVDQVQSALLPDKHQDAGSDYSMDDSDQLEDDEGLSESTDDCSDDMNEELEEPEDDLTLGQFQEGVRKASRARKGNQSSTTAQKKGRIEGSNQDL